MEVTIINDSWIVGELDVIDTSREDANAPLIEEQDDEEDTSEDASDYIERDDPKDPDYIAPPIE